MEAINILTDDDEQISHATVAINSNENLNQTEPFSVEIYDSLVIDCLSNIDYFGRVSKSTITSERFLDAFHNILQNIETIRKYVTEFNEFAHEYDFDEETRANGYRSIIKVTHEYIKHTAKMSKYIAENHGNLLFRKQTYMKEIESISQALASLCSIFNEVKKVKEKCERGLLIPSGEHKAIGLFNISAAIDQNPFYGRCIGLHYCSSMRPIAKFMGIFMAAFSEQFYSKRSNRIVKMTTSMYKGSKYHRQPELRAKRILELSLFSTIDFIKSFLSLTETKLLHGPPNVFNVKIKVNRMLTIPPDSLEIENVNEPNNMVEIPVPSSHLGVQPIRARLLSNVRRRGMQFNGNKHRVHPSSNSLLFHCHGGGFIAHTSKSHEMYLRGWAAQLQVPILSVDYSLSPQAPYPRALEEIFYAYCWAIKNAELLGTTAERIILVGDSAGATLNMALVLKCIDQSVRLPDGVFSIYAPLILNFEPGPSRILCSFIDIMLPMGFQMGYIKAYLHPDKKTDASTTSSVTNELPTTSQLIENNNEPSSNSINRRLSTSRNPADDYLFDIPRDPFISPLYAGDEMLKEFPPIKFLTLENDPFLDENITMAKRLKLLGKSVELDIVPGLPHGFLHFVQVSKDANDANRLCIKRLTELLGKTEMPSRDQIPESVYM